MQQTLTIRIIFHIILIIEILKILIHIDTSLLKFQSYGNFVIL